MRTTFQPLARSRRKLRWSRARFARSLSRQNIESLCSHVGSRQPCQKSPSTKIATRSLGKTISGEPGSERLCSRNRSPAARSSLCTCFSSEPFLSFTSFIARERCSGVKWSGIAVHCQNSGDLLLSLRQERFHSPFDIFTHSRKFLFGFVRQQRRMRDRVSNGLELSGVSG